MRRTCCKRPLGILGIVGLVVATVAAPCAGQWMTRTYNLFKGKNYIYLDVQPDRDAVTTVIGQVYSNIDAVAQWQSRYQNFQFLSSPDSPSIPQDRFLYWRPHYQLYEQQIGGLAAGTLITYSFDLAGCDGLSITPTNQFVMGTNTYSYMDDQSRYQVVCRPLDAATMVVDFYQFNGSCPAPVLRYSRNSDPQVTTVLMPLAQGQTPYNPQTLEHIIGGAAYIFVCNSNCTLTVTGTPVVPDIRWEADLYNLVGFPIGTNVSVMDYFRNVPGIDVGQGGQQHVYMIDSNGTPRAITMAGGRAYLSPFQAYWIYCNETLDYTAPLALIQANPYGLNFGSANNYQMLTLRNDYTTNLAVTVTHVGSAAPPAGGPPLEDMVPLTCLVYTNYQVVTVVTNPGPVVVTNVVNGWGWVWTNFPAAGMRQTLAPGDIWMLRLGIDRSQMVSPYTNAVWASILQVSDSLGTLYNVGLSATLGDAGAPASGWPAGLWVGEAALTKVSTMTDAGNLQAVSAPFPFKLILHLDGDGNAHLLQRVVLALNSQADPDGNVTNAFYELYTDEADVPADRATTYRVSSVALGVRSPVPLGGVMFSALSGAWVTPYDDVMNPFVHAAHPSHDNLSADFSTKLPNGQESYTVTNTITLSWSNAPLAQTALPFWNMEERSSGRIRLVVDGLLRNTVVAEGVFELRRVNSTAWLEDGP